MEHKIQELTERIYREGVQKGEEQAGQIIADAESKAVVIISDAKTRADAIISEAQKQAVEIKRSIEADLKLSGMQAISSVKQQITNAVTAGVLENSVKESLSDPSVLKHYIETVLQNWKMSSGGAPSIEVLLPQAMQTDLEMKFKKSVADLLNQGLQINYDKNIKAGFKIGPADGAYKISLTDTDFIEFFKMHLRPRVKTILFGDE